MNRLFLRWWWALLVIPLLLGLARVRFDIDVLNLLPDEIQEVHGLKLFQQHFTNSRELLITVRGETVDAAVAAARMLVANLGTQTSLASNIVWQPPWEEHPEQIAELIGSLWLNQPPNIFAELTNRLAPANFRQILDDAKEQLRTSISPLALGRLAYDPFGLTQLPDQDSLGRLMVQQSQDWFASRDGKLRVIYVESPEYLGDYRVIAKWLARLRLAVDQLSAKPEWPSTVAVRFTGAPAFIAETATGMERDLKGSVLFTLIFVAASFWYAHRNFIPLLCLGAFLVLIVLGTLACGGFIWRQVNALSLGFAAILLGLAVDYALVLYEEAAAAPKLSAREVRSLIAPSIVWSAITTAAAFGLLTFAGLPGLSQLGLLVAIGIMLASVVMLYGFLPLVLRVPRRVIPESQPTTRTPVLTPNMGILWITGMGVVVASVVLIRTGWNVDHGTRALEPRHCPAQVALQELERELNHRGQPILLLFGGTSEGDVARRLDEAESKLSKAQANHEIREFALPTRLWPHANHARTNLLAAEGFSAQLGAMRSAVLQAGFTSEAMDLTERVVNYWKSQYGRTEPIWPTNEASRWILKRAAVWTGTEWLAAGMALDGAGNALPRALTNLRREDQKVWITGWPWLAEALLGRVETRFIGLLIVTITLVTSCLWLAFRRWTEVLLSGATLAFSLLVLLSVAGVAGWSWNIMTVMAFPLLLGAGVDYPIHIQLALRRHQGDIRSMRRVTGRAVFLCAATTVAGFGSNAFSSNAGLASLGSVCATGIASVYLCASYLLPTWWIFLHQNRLHSGAQKIQSESKGPPKMYRAWVWALGRVLAHSLPQPLCRVTARFATALYCRLHPHRRAIVEQNLKPVLGGDLVAARRAARRLYSNFGMKIALLLRCENDGIGELTLTRWTGWEWFIKAQSRGRGVLLITPHLGDWELGGYLITKQGVRLLVLTQAEPGEGFTELRQQSRAKSGIDTLVIGQDAFASVEIIKRLNSGGVVALLVDRPPPATAVTVELFGRPFLASIAAAELARASGCAVLPVLVVHQASGVEAHVLPEITYDRGELGSRESRRQLTQQILRVFEPAIRKYADQWYHFVPIWPVGEFP